MGLAAAVSSRPRIAGPEIRLPGMTKVHCIGCGEVLFEYRPGRVRAASLAKGLIVARCKKARCHNFNRFEVPETIAGA